MPWKPLKREKRKPGAQLWCSDSRLWRILDVWLVLCKPTFSTWSALRPYKQGLGLRKEAECLRVWKLSTKQFFLILFIIKTWPFYWMFNEGEGGLLDMGPKMLRCDKRKTWFSTSALGICPQFKINATYQKRIITCHCDLRSFCLASSSCLHLF